MNKERLLKIIQDMEEVQLFLNEARLLRNRISHRHKEPSTEELVKFISCNVGNFVKVTAIMKKFL